MEIDLVFSFAAEVGIIIYAKLAIKVSSFSFLLEVAVRYVRLY